MPQKKLQKESIYAEYDEDGDGIVTDEELSHVKEIKEIETNINACKKLADFIKLFDTPVDKDGVPTGNPPIFDFPEEI